jgi:hypothetical protein
MSLMKLYRHSHIAQYRWRQTHSVIGRVPFSESIAYGLRLESRLKWKSLASGHFSVRRNLSTAGKCGHLDGVCQAVCTVNQVRLTWVTQRQKHGHMFTCFDRRGAVLTGAVVDSPAVCDVLSLCDVGYTQRVAVSAILGSDSTLLM